MSAKAVANWHVGYAKGYQDALSELAQKYDEGGLSLLLGYAKAQVPVISQEAEDFQAAIDEINREV